MAPVTFIDLAYCACFALLLGMAVLVHLRGRRLAARHGALPLPHGGFVGTVLSLLAWLVTLYLFRKSDDPGFVLLVGRVNFAAVAFAAFYALGFVRAVAGLPPTRQELWYAWITFAVATVTALTPLVDAAEQVMASSRHVTVYGPAFPLYLLYVAAFLASAVWVAFRERARQERGPVRDQLALVGAGTLATGAVALVTNAVLPYAFGDFHFIDAGPLASVLFLAAVGYAILKHRLFDIRVLVRRTVVYGLLLSASLAAYSALVVLATDWLAGEGKGAAERFAVLLVAFSFDPLRRFLDGRVDALLFPRKKEQP